MRDGIRRRHIDSDLAVTNYREKNYEQYRKICCECFRELSLAANTDSDAFYSKSELSKKKFGIFVLFERKEISGPVVKTGNVIDHLFANKK